MRMEMRAERRIGSPVGPRRRRFKTWYYIEYGFVRTLFFVCRVWPKFMIAPLAYVFSLIAPLYPRSRIAFANAAFAFGRQMSPREIRRLVRRSFFNLCRSFVECAKFSPDNIENLKEKYSYTGEEAFYRIVERGKGVIVFTAHLGNWELSGAYVSHVHHPLAALMRFMPNPLLNRFVLKQRERMKIGLIPNQDAGPLIQRFLKANNIVVFLADQYGGGKGVPVMFFGRPTMVARGPFIFSLRTGAGLLPVFFVRDPERPDRHVINVQPEIVIERHGDLERNIAAAAQKVIDSLEDHIRKYPDQYLWIHRGWR